MENKMNAGYINFRRMEEHVELTMNRQMVFSGK
jgi:hypothetical protein